MAGLLEPEIVNSWLFNTLINDATLVALQKTRVYPTGQIPQNPLYPYTRYHMQYETDHVYLGPKRNGIGGIWMVVTVMHYPLQTGQVDTRRDIVGRMDEMLSKFEVISGGLQIKGYRKDYYRPEPDQTLTTYDAETGFFINIDAQPA